MADHYFQRVHALTPTKFWINNPTRQEADWALAEGALGCTCNPSYCGKMLFDRPEEGDYVSQVLDEVLKNADTATAAEEELQRRLVAVIAEKFMPLYRQVSRANMDMSAFRAIRSTKMIRRSSSVRRARTVRWVRTFAARSPPPKQA